MAPHFSRGKNDAIAFVFSCPGRLESECGYPAAGTTGRNLEQLLRLVSAGRSGPPLARSEITIANSWDVVEYKRKTGRTEASDEEVLSNQNIERLAREVEHVTTLLVFCGRKATLAAGGLFHRGLLPKNPAIAHICHLGGRSLNKIALDAQGNEILSVEKQKNMGSKDAKGAIGKRNTSRRLTVLAGGLVLDFNRALSVDR